MSRSYKSVRPKAHRVYSVDELMTLYGVSRNTVTNWIKSGLEPSDRKPPYIFRGAVVRVFHEDRRERYRTRLRPGEFKCLGCKSAVRPSPDLVETRETAPGKACLRSRCPECSALLLKLASAADLAILAGDSVPNTSGDCAHEGDSAGPARIGNEAADRRQVPYLRNDRTIAAWQLYAARHSVKTQDRHLAAIRQFEDHVRGKRFDRLTQEDVSGFRDSLRRALSAGAEDALSKSTVSHVLSHVRDFLAWLLKQKGFESLPRDLPDYLQLSRAEYADALPRAPRAYPQIDEAEAMLAAMPRGTRLERRARAIFATAFLGALRADTLVSLRVGHIDVAGRIIVQDGSVSRTKNGKSLRIRWFPIPEAFGQELEAWLGELAALGAGPEDALFPPEGWLNASRHTRRNSHLPAPVMTSTHAASEAFRIASRAAGADYTPHAAKHTIAALRGTLHLTEEQRKAWSQNMGHETEAITETHYGKLSEARCDEMFEQMESEGDGQDDRTGGEGLSKEEEEDLRQAAITIMKLVQRHGISLKD